MRQQFPASNAEKNVTNNSASEGFISIYFVLSDIYLVYYVVAII